MRLHTYEWGDAAAPPLVCLHGVTGHGERFRRLAEEHWAKRFRVIAPDLRGHGRSGWAPPWTFATHTADVVETLADLGIDHADFVGHSWGGRMVLELAAAHPGLVSRAVLLDPAIQTLPHVSLYTADQTRADEYFSSAEDYAERRGDGPATPRAFVIEDGEQLLDPAPNGKLRRRLSEAAAVSIFGELAAVPPPPETLNVPTLLIYAPEYGLVREEQLAAYADRVEIQPVPGMHMVIWDAYDEVAAAVDRFLT